MENYYRRLPPICGKDAPAGEICSTFQFNMSARRQKGTRNLHKTFNIQHRISNGSRFADELNVER
jgi:hypothetical protein